MWRTKKFSSRVKMHEWLERNGWRVQWHEIYVNNCPAAIEYKMLRWI